MLAAGRLKAGGRNQALGCRSIIIVMSPLRVAVLRGGPSQEYEVSLKSGAAVLEALDRKRFAPVDVVISQEGEWLIDGFVRYPEHIIGAVDVVFNALHGAYGEDGTVQRQLDRYSVPYTGSGAFAARIAMHKVFTKDRLADHGVKMAPHMLVTRQSLGNEGGVADTALKLLGTQYVLKPVCSGSSVGVVLVENNASLAAALTHALEKDEEIIIEKRVAGKEATCGVIDRFRGQEQYVLPPVEIVPPSSRPFFDYHAKYSGETLERCPGHFTKEEKQEMSRLALLAHETLGLSQYSRSDFIVAKDGIYFLETNTLPGLTPASLLPVALTAVGVPYHAFIEHLIDDALGRVYPFAPQ